MAYSYSVAALVAAHTALRDLLDSHATEPGYLEIYDDSETPVLLGTITLGDPCGTVNAGTGQLTFAETVRDEAADASGTADHGVFKTGAGDVVLTLDCQAGASPVEGFLVLNSLTIIAGGPIELVGATVG
jgi:hypothetical protein